MTKAEALCSAMRQVGCACLLAVHVSLCRRRHLAALLSQTSSFQALTNLVAVGRKQRVRSASLAVLQSIMR